MNITISNTNKFCVMYGGKSSEHEVSLRSAASIIRNAPYKDEEILLIGVTKNGEFFLQPEEIVGNVRSGQELSIHSVTKLAGLPNGGLIRLSTGQPLPIAMIFPVIHGTTGEDGVLQGFLEICGLPYVGSGVLGSSLGMDKEKVKHVWGEAGLPVVPYALLRSTLTPSNTFETVYQDLSIQLESKWLFIKPSRGGSSVGIGLAKNAVEFATKLATAFSYDTKVIIEKAINAREVEISVMGNDKPISYSFGEVIPVGHEFYDYESKYLDPNGSQIIIPAQIDKSVGKQLRSLAEKAYVACEARGFSRVDFFIDKDTQSIYLNEINTIPGFTNISMFPMMCESGGLPYADIVTNLVEYGFEEHSRRESLNYSR